MPVSLSDIIISVLSFIIIRSFVQALNDIRKSAHEYSDFMDELNLMRIILKTVEEHKLLASAPDNFRALLHDKIRHCENIIEVASERVKKFALLRVDSLAHKNQSARFRFKRQLYKVRWWCTRKKEVQGFEKTLSTCRQHLLFLQTIQIAYASRFPE
jgi:hypothetical protein